MGPLQVLEEPFIVLCDNVSSRRNMPEDVLVNGEIHYLPKYSPFLNACETAGSVVKAAVKRRMTEPDVQREIYDRDVDRAGETLHMRRIRVVSREVEDALPAITPRKCADFYQHVLNYMPACANDEDIFV